MRRGSAIVPDETTEPVPVEYPFPASVPPTPEELAIVRALARQAAREFIEGKLDLDDE